MKKVVSLVAVLALVTSVAGAQTGNGMRGNTVYKNTSDNIKVVNNFRMSSGRAPMYAQPQMAAPDYSRMQQPVARPRYTCQTCGAWYVGGRANLSMLSWENEYTTTFSPTTEEYNHDKYSFEPIFGGSFAFGYAFDTSWRLEVEAGLLGRFEDNDEGVNFTLTVPYALANAYNDFENGMYVGVGLGLAVPKTELDGEHNGLVFEGGHRTKRQGSLMGAAMSGYAYDFDQHLTLDIRYRLAAFNGTKHETVLDDGTDTYEFRNKIGLILDNSVSMGLRYRF